MELCLFVNFMIIRRFLETSLASRIIGIAYPMRAVYIIHTKRDGNSTHRALAILAPLAQTASTSFTNAHTQKRGLQQILYGLRRRTLTNKVATNICPRCAK